MKLAPLPPRDLNRRPLPIDVLSVGTDLVRIHWPDRALFFGPANSRPRGRFDSTDGAFGVCYLAEQTPGALVETFLREGHVKLIAQRDLEARRWSRIRVAAPLRLVLCHGPALTVLRTTSAIASGAYSRSRAWASAFFHHPDAPDGVRYRARHDDDELCIALFDRAQDKVVIAGTHELLDPVTGVVDAINRYGVAVSSV